VAVDAGVNFEYDAAGCGNKFDSGDIPEPWAGFGSCDLNAGLGFCENTDVQGDNTVMGQMAIGCRLACGLAPVCPSAEAEVGKCAFNVHISSAAWADEIHWAVDDHYSEPGKYSENQEYNEEVMLAPGEHTFIGYDVYGDGWNGGTFSLTNSGMYVCARERERERERK
jgi:hypothetical protein